MPGMVYLTPNFRGHQVADPDQCPPLVLPPGGQRPGIQHPVQLTKLPLIQPARQGCPLDASRLGGGLGDGRNLVAAVEHRRLRLVQPQDRPELRGRSG